MESENDNQQNNSLPLVYALLWKSAQKDDEFDQQKFNERIPQLMAWLRQLYSQEKLVACGGGGFEEHTGGLTLIRTDTLEDAIAISKQNPMNDIGSTELLVWDVFYGNLSVTERQNSLS